MPDSLSYTPPPHRHLVLTGAGALGFTSAANAGLPVTGEGAVAFAATTANTSLNLSSEAFLMFGYDTELRAAGTGTVAFTTAPTVTDDLVGAGTLSLPAAPASPLALPGSGALAMAAAPAPALTLTGTGTLSFVAAPSFSPMGMDKSGTFAVTSNTTALVTGWAARSGYPGTVITSNALVSDGPSNVIVHCKVTLTGAWSNSTALTLRVLKNGTQIASTTIPFNGTTVTFSPISTSLVSGDTISLQYSCPFGASGTVQSGSTNTHLYYDAA
ncbi:hypothetical protein [Nocardia sp. NPDC057455]|uniref:hypothetical protein n=1 Tax=Nocardia sp. NPDC057455 TaxID=3346138 RepID=UPI00366BE785